MIETLEKWNAELVAEKISLLAEAEASTIEIQRLKAENQTLRLKLETLGPNDDISNSDTANPLQPTEEANSHDVEQVRESESRQAVKVEKEGEPEINLGEPAVVTKRPRSSGPQDADGEHRSRPSKRRALRVEVFVPSLQDVRAMASREDRASASKSNDTNNPHTDLVPRSFEETIPSTDLQTSAAPSVKMEVDLKPKIEPMDTGASGKLPLDEPERIRSLIGLLKERTWGMRADTALLLPFYTKTIQARLNALESKPCTITLDPDRLIQIVTRPFLSSVFGNRTVPKPMFLNPTHDPHCPRVPGQRGLFFSGASEEEIQRWPSVFRLIVRAAPCCWLYVGDYQLVETPRFTLDEWKAQTERVRRSWTRNFVARKTDNSGLREDMEAFIRENTDNASGRASKGNQNVIKFSEDDVYNAWNNGHGMLKVWCMVCVQYDEAFQQEIIEKKQSEIEEVEADVVV